MKPGQPTQHVRTLHCPEESPSNEHDTKDLLARLSGESGEQCLPHALKLCDRKRYRLRGSRVSAHDCARARNCTYLAGAYCSDVGQACGQLRLPNPT
jgi:hypothetical protein